MKIAIPKETEKSEKRVAATPETVKKMTALGLAVAIESDAGKASSFLNSEYETAGAKIVSGVQTLLQDASIVLKVQKPASSEVSLLKEGAILVALLQPRTNPDLLSQLAKRKITAFSMDLIPRIARAQNMDVLSSQSNIAGYKAVIMAADRLKKMMPLMMTAAGTITPAKVLILGAGVAGLQSIATAKRLGAVVEAFDTRTAVKEQVESLGGKFLSLPLTIEETEDKGGYAKALSHETHLKEQALIEKHVKEADIVITTAQIPGKPAPLLITGSAVKNMKEGSIIVDLASETGGNCELTEKGVEAVKHGVTLIGTLNIPSLVTTHAAQLYARNIFNFLSGIYKNGEVTLNLKDPVIQETLVTHDGKILVKES